MVRCFTYISGRRIWKKTRNIWFLNKTRFILGFTNITSLKNGDDYLCFVWSMSDMALMKEMSPMTTWEKMVKGQPFGDADFFGSSFGHLNWVVRYLPLGVAFGNSWRYVRLHIFSSWSFLRIGTWNYHELENQFLLRI